MHLSLDFLQSITDLVGDFERLVLPCLDLANLITYEMDTSKLGDPEAVSTIKRLRRFQSEWMHQLRERWGDLLQTASEFDESATFEQLSDIVEYTEDSTREAWLEARSFVSSCEEKLRYRLNDTFLADIFTSIPAPLLPIRQVIPAQSPCKRELRYHLSDTFLHDMFTSEPSQLPMTNKEGTPKLAVQQHAPMVSCVNTMAICGAVAHHVKPCKETLPVETTLGRYNKANINDTTTSSLGPERKGHTPVNDPDSVHGRASTRHLTYLSTTLNAQERRIVNTISDIKGEANDRTLEEIKILASTARESTNQVISLLMAEPPTHSNPMASTPKSETTDTSPVKLTRTANTLQIKFHDQANFTKLERITSIISKRTNNDGPTFNPMNSYWLHHQPKVSLSGQQIKPSSGSAVIPIKTPPGNSYSMGNTTNESEDHNWRQRNNASYTREAVFEGHILKNTANTTHI